jgi:hypothetical protein
MTQIKKNVAISDSGFIFDSNTGETFSVNPIGLEIMMMIKSGTSYEGISSHFFGKYEVDSEVFERYYYDFLATLKQFQLLDSEGHE